MNKSELLVYPINMMQINEPGDLVLGVGHPLPDRGHLLALQPHQLLVDRRLPLHRHFSKRLPPLSTLTTSLNMIRRTSDIADDQTQNHVHHMLYVHIKYCCISPVEQKFHSDPHVLALLRAQIPIENSHSLRLNLKGRRRSKSWTRFSPLSVRVCK